MLTDREISLVQENWAEVYKDPTGNGTVILKTFLDKYDYYHKFDKFKGIPIDEITDNATFKYHVRRLMETLDQSFKNLKNTDELKRILNGIGNTHKRRKINKIEFEELRDVVLDILKTIFKISAEAEQAWVKTFNIALPLIFECLEQ